MICDTAALRPPNPAAPAPASNLTLLPNAGQFARMISISLRLAACCTALHMAAAADWPQWRGPGRTGHIPKGETGPDKLPLELPVAWRVKVGDGLASPIVATGKVFYLDNQAGQETVHAADAGSGKPIWRA